MKSNTPDAEKRLALATALLFVLSLMNQANQQELQGGGEFLRRPRAVACQNS